MLSIPFTRFRDRIIWEPHNDLPCVGQHFRAISLPAMTEGDPVFVYNMLGSWEARYIGFCGEVLRELVISRRLT